MMAEDVEQVVFESQDAIILSGQGILLEEGCVFGLGRHVQGNSLPRSREPVEGKTVGHVPEELPQRDHLIEIRPCQSEHDVRSKTEAFGGSQEGYYLVEVATPSHCIVMLLQPLETHLIVEGSLDLDQSLDIVTQDWVSEN